MPVLALPRSLEAPVTVLPRLYAAEAKRLARLGIETVRDLLLTLPYDWETYGAPAQVAGLDDGKQATVVGTVTSISAKQSLRRRIKLTEATIRDDEGAPLRLVWFNCSETRPGSSRRSGSTNPTSPRTCTRATVSRWRAR